MLKQSRLALIAIFILAACTGPGNVEGSQRQPPKLTDAQQRELEERARSPESLGIEVTGSGSQLRFKGVNEISGTEAVTATLVDIGAEEQQSSKTRCRIPVVSATVHGTSGVQVVLDTGANWSWIGYSFGKRLKIPAIAGLVLSAHSAIGGDVEGVHAIIPSLQIGTLEFRNPLTLIGPDGAALRTRYENQYVKHRMILGIDVLRRLSYLTIDYPRGKVTFAPTGDYERQESRRVIAKVPLLWRAGKPTVEVKLDQRNTVEAIVDTGCDFKFVVSNIKAKELGYQTRPDESAMPGGPPGMQGLGGRVRAREFEISELLLGKTLFKTFTAHNAAQVFSKDGDHILLGSGLLSLCCVTFDFARNTLWLEQ